MGNRKLDHMESKGTFYKLSKNKENTLYGGFMHSTEYSARIGAEAKMIWGVLLIFLNLVMVILKSWLSSNHAHFYPTVLSSARCKEALASMAFHLLPCSCGLQKLGYMIICHDLDPWTSVSRPVS